MPRAVDTCSANLPSVFSTCRYGCEHLAPSQSILVLWACFVRDPKGRQVCVLVPMCPLPLAVAFALPLPPSLRMEASQHHGQIPTLCAVSEGLPQTSLLLPPALLPPPERLSSFPGWKLLLRVLFWLPEPVCLWLASLHALPAPICPLPRFLFLRAVSNFAMIPVSGSLLSACAEGQLTGQGTLWLPAQTRKQQQLRGCAWRT